MQEPRGTAPNISSLLELQTILLQNRQFDLSVINHEPKKADLTDPFLLNGMEVACKRIRQAIENQERIMIFGDFDADGITSTVILVHALTELGAAVSYRIPDRTKDNHGLKNYFIDEMVENNVSLLITCDCGVNDRKVAAYAQSKNIDVIITDHHEPDKDKFPTEATAVINPKLSTNYPHKNLSGSAVSLKLIQALINEKDFPNNWIDRYIEVAAIGVVADCVPLTGENRLITQLGLQQLTNSNWPGLQTLLLNTQSSTDNITAGTISFGLAPHLNAASRLGDVMVAAQLFLGEPAKHSRRVQYLRDLNNDRKTLTKTSLDQVKPQIDPSKSCQVVFHEAWEPGILGLIAGRLTEELKQPVIACTLVGTELAASCRAPAGLSIIDSIRENENLLMSFGGHTGAAGFTAEYQNLDVIKTALEKYFSKQPTVDPDVNIEAWVESQMLDNGFISFLEQLAPFGQQNPVPILGIKDFHLESIQPLGQSGDHYALHGTQNGQKLKIVAFFWADKIEKLKAETTISLACEVCPQYWNNKKSLQWKLVDIEK